MSNSRKPVALSVVMLLALSLSACGGGGSGGQGTAATVESAPAASPSPPAGAEPAPEGTSPALAPFIKRAFDTVNPVAVYGLVDFEQSPDFASSETTVAYSLESADGARVVTLYPQESDGAGGYFPNSRTFVRFEVPRTDPGSYVLKARASSIDPSTHEAVKFEASVPLEVGALGPLLASLSSHKGLVYNGLSRLLSFAYPYTADGTLYLYPLGQAAGVCPAKSMAELDATPNVTRRQVAVRNVHITYFDYTSAAPFADADTACFQFVRSSDGVAEAPYTFHVRYQPMLASGDMLLALAGGSATTPKLGLSLSSLPAMEYQPGTYPHFNWRMQRQLFAVGDAPQQTTSNSARITLEQTGESWQYRLAAPAASDHPYYVAKAEGRPPVVFFLAQP